jgi:hypothetical protein
VIGSAGGGRRWGARTADASDVESEVSYLARRLSSCVAMSRPTGFALWASYLRRSPDHARFDATCGLWDLRRGSVAAGVAHRATERSDRVAGRHSGWLS